MIGVKTKRKEQGGEKQTTVKEKGESNNKKADDEIGFESNAGERDGPGREGEETKGNQRGSFVVGKNFFDEVIKRNKGNDREESVGEANSKRSEAKKFNGRNHQPSLKGKFVVAKRFEKN